ncbi:MAG: acyl-CoA dehydrogenase family protein, partial [Pseudomonadota bacterium]
MTDILVFMLIALGVYWWLAYSERPPTWWLTATLGLFAAAATAGVLGAASILLLGLPPLLVALALGVVPVRRRFISRPLLRQFRRVLPPLSGTEKAAIDAGTVWWDGELFSGRPDWQELLSTPAARLSPEEQAFLDGPIEKLCALLDDWRITHEDRDLPPEVWDFIREERLFGMIIPRRYGGLEFSAFAHSQVVMKLSSRSITAAVTTMVPNS